MKQPQIIFLNGTSSAGKTSIALKLQELFTEPFIHIGVDTFLFMLPSRYLFEGQAAHMGYNFIRVDDEEGARVVVENGQYARVLNRVKRSTMKSLLDEKFNLVVDEVLYSDEDFQEYLELFAGYRMTFVAIKPPIEVAQKREQDRGDRMIGLARGLHEIVHANKSYDLHIDSSTVTPEEAARMIHEHIEGSSK